MAHSRIMADTSRRMWDLSDFLINTSDVPQPFSAALDDRHADHERILAALHAGDQETARAEMEKHIVGTVDVIRAEVDKGERQPLIYLCCIDGLAGGDDRFSALVEAPG